MFVCWISIYFESKIDVCEIYRYSLKASHLPLDRKYYLSSFETICLIQDKANQKRQQTNSEFSLQSMLCESPINVKNGMGF